jgi:hypothetical protein
MTDVVDPLLEGKSWAHVWPQPNSQIAGVGVGATGRGRLNLLPYMTPKRRKRPAHDF